LPGVGLFLAPSGGKIGQLVHREDGEKSAGVWKNLAENIAGYIAV